MLSPGTHRRFIRFALVALLLAVQTLAHAHGVDHGAPPGKAQCAVCAIVQAGGHAIVDGGADALPEKPPRAIFEPTRPPAGRSLAAPRRARSPPSTP